MKVFAQGLRGCCSHSMKMELRTHRRGRITRKVLKDHKRKRRSLMAKGKVLVIGSNATRIEVQGGGTGPTGNYLNETVVPAMAFIKAGYTVVLATPNGTKPHIDEASDSAVHFGGDKAAYERAKSFWANDPAVNNVRTLRSVIDEGLDNYSAVFVPGGQAPV